MKLRRTVMIIAMEIHQITGFSIQFHPSHLTLFFHSDRITQMMSIRFWLDLEDIHWHKLVSSEEWEEQVPDEKEVENEKYANPRQSDGRNKRGKTTASANQHRGGFYFDPPDCLKHRESGVIVIDHKKEYCFKYDVWCFTSLQWQT